MLELSALQIQNPKNQNSLPRQGSAPEALLGTPDMVGEDGLKESPDRIRGGEPRRHRTKHET